MPPQGLRSTQAPPRSWVDPPLVQERLTTTNTNTSWRRPLSAAAAQAWLVRVINDGSPRVITGGSVEALKPPPRRAEACHAGDSGNLYHDRNKSKLLGATPHLSGILLTCGQ